MDMFSLTKPEEDALRSIKSSNKGPKASSIEYSGAPSGLLDHHSPILHFFPKYFETDFSPFFIKTIIAQF